MAADYSLSVRFGDSLLDAGFTAVPNIVLNSYAKLGILPSELIFILQIWQYWWTDKLPYPPLRAIADKMQISKRQVLKYVSSLQEKGYLLVTHRYGDNGALLASEYDFSPLIRAVVAHAQREATIGEEGTIATPPW